MTNQATITSPVVCDATAASIFATILTRGPIARNEIAQLLDLSPATVSKAVRPTMDAGFLVESGGPVDQDSPQARPGGPLVPPRGRHNVDDALAAVTWLVDKLRVEVSGPGGQVTPLGVAACGADLDITAAAALAREGNQEATAAFTAAGDALGRALAIVANLLSPHRIVLSGEELAGSDLFESAARESFARHAFGEAVDCDLVTRPLPDHTWARGAAAVAIQHLFSGPTTGIPMR